MLTLKIGAWIGYQALYVLRDASWAALTIGGLFWLSLSMSDYRMGTDIIGMLGMSPGGDGVPAIAQLVALGAYAQMTAYCVIMVAMLSAFVRLCTPGVRWLAARAATLVRTARGGSAA